MRKIFPIVAIILLTMVSCHRSGDSYVEDCFTIEYRQPVNGYQVKAVVNKGNDDEILEMAHWDSRIKARRFC